MKENRWTHAICDKCWDKRMPTRVTEPYHERRQELEACCFCGEPTYSGLFIRDNPEAVPCKGEHESVRT